MATIDKRLKVLFNKYAAFITENSETTGDVENLCKYLSYFVTGRNRALNKFDK